MATFLEDVLAVDGRRRLRRERVFRDRMNPIDVFNDDELLSRYRFPRQLILRITDDLKDDIARKTRRNCALPAVIQVVVALRFYATGSFLKTCGDLAGVHKTSACRIVRKISLLLEKKAQATIFVPSDPAVLANLKNSFQNVAGFPGALGCIDGTHIKVAFPSEDEWRFVNGKGQHSINCQFICDTQHRFMNCVARWPGGTHDDQVLVNSYIYNEYQQNPPNGVILGDSGYPLLSWLMTPIQNPQLPSEHRYNDALYNTHCLIERTFSLWKRRFHSVNGELRMSPLRVCAVISATAYLHNLALNNGLPEPEDLNDIDINDGGHSPVMEELADMGAMIQRNAILEQCFT